MKLFGGPKDPEEVAARVPPGQRLVKGWPVLHYGPIPRFDESTWDFKVGGLVENPFTVSYSELKALGPAKIPADMHCVTGWTTLDNEWEGIPFEVVKSTARTHFVLFHAYRFGTTRRRGSPCSGANGSPRFAHASSTSSSSMACIERLAV